MAATYATICAARTSPGEAGTYMVDGRQYVIIASGGATAAYVAYALNQDSDKRPEAKLGWTPIFAMVGGSPARPCMFLEHRDLLTPAEVARLTGLAQSLKFVEGRLSNPANVTKNNLQAELGSPGYVEASQIVMAALERSRSFAEFAMPRKIAPPLLARYEPGMKYGAHADTAFMTIPGVSGPLRSDLSCTVFLSDPKSYEGGELVLHIGTRAVVFKGQPGEAFVYPSTLLHEVRPVRAGQRLVSITFIESLIPDEQDRNALYELRDILSLEGLKMDWVNRVRMEVVCQNLARSWSRA